MYLDDIVSAQKRGEEKGIPSVCSAHPFVIRQSLKVSEAFGVPPLIEATCNQVNQYGGYTGMTPKNFVASVRELAQEVDFPFENIILGGDHLGPNVWQKEPAESAMQKSEEMIRQYVQAGFSKLHLDCSMRLADDPPGALDVRVIASRAARLAKAAESALTPILSTNVRGTQLRYIIGTEVPIPGGATEHKEGVSVTNVEDAKQTIEATREAFLREGLAEAWERVVGVVVQPGVEFGDDFVLPYDPTAARALSKFIESQAVIYEAHSTDYQMRESLMKLVRDHFAILKVGPGLTFAFREAVFALAMMENELIAKGKRSDVIQVLDAAMATHPEHWINYYRGTEDEQQYKRKYSLSDRARYYWGRPEVQTAYKRLMDNLGSDTLPYSLLSQFGCQTNLTAGQVIAKKIWQVLENYFSACGRTELPFAG